MCNLADHEDFRSRRQEGLQQGRSAMALTGYENVGDHALTPSCIGQEVEPHRAVGSGGRASGMPVSAVDIMPTLLDLTANSTPPNLDGRDLLSLG